MTIFSSFQGCNCFALSHKLKLLVTGSPDGIVRIWNSLIVSSPIAAFDDHRSQVVDIQIMSNQEVILSFSADGVSRSFVNVPTN